MINRFTRYAVAVALPDQTLSFIIHAVLEHLICLYGTPRRIVTDQGRAYDSDSFNKFCILLRI